MVEGVALMNTIWKFKMTGVSTVIEMPLGARVLTAQVQHGDVVLWASFQVEYAGKKRTRTFVARPTGSEFSVGNEAYIATVQAAGGDLVWHIFEVIRP